jgi:hypothetical protein
MSRILVICRQRLGDIIGCFPAALSLAEAGHEVDFCCFAQYHAIFRTVSYCRPVGLEALKANYDRVFDLEVTRAEYDAYRASKIKWRDYIYNKYPDLDAARNLAPKFDRTPEIEGYPLPARYNLACPIGISQVTLVNLDWFTQQCRNLSPGPWYFLTDKPDRSLPRLGQPLRARALDHLPTLIAGADIFVTINSAPNIIASGVRSSWYQVYEPGFGGQDNYDAPGQIVLHQPRDIARNSWRFWVHYWRRSLMGIDTSQDAGK